MSNEDGALPEPESSPLATPPEEAPSEDQSADAEGARPSRIGPYRLERRLGSGGMGEVFVAHDERLNRRVALKRFHTRLQSPRVRQRFQREARALAALNHPVVVQIYDLLELDDEPWIVMEFVDGRALDERLKWGPLSVGETVRIAREVVSGLTAAHAVGLVHRDLKAGNVLVSRNGQVKILDFGLATEPVTSDDPAISIEGRLIGTPVAMSPEQTLGQKVDHRSDLFSLGSLLYHVLTAHPPFASGDSIKTMARVRSVHPPRLDRIDPAVPAALATLIDHLLEKEPDRRPQAAREVAVALDELIAQGHASDVEVTQDAEQTLAADYRVDSYGVLSPTSDPAAGGSAHSPARRSAAPSEERRLVTVLVCELVSGDASSGAIDPEELVELGPRLRELVQDAVQRYEGHLEGFQGHRLTAYFGYPRAHEDDARRALLAAREVLENGSSLQSRFGDRLLAVKAGVHTGPGVATIDASHHSQLMLGPTIDTAVLLSQGAGPNQAVISPATKPLVEPYFRLEPTRSLDGQSAWRVGEATAETTSLSSRALTRMVSREHELRLMVDRWRLAQESEGQVISVSGEPGIGKSRLLVALRRELEAGHDVSEEAPQWVELGGSAYHTDSPLRPLRQWLRERILEAKTDERDPTERLEGFLSSLGLDPAELMPFLTELLSLPHSERYPLPEDLPPGGQRAATLDALHRLLLAVAESEPTVLVFEDLHWADPSTLEVLERLIVSANSVPVLVVLTARPEFNAPWPNRHHVTQLALNRLTANDAAALLDQVAGADELTSGLRARILENTDGIPLFVEEVTRNVLEEIERGALDPETTSIDVPMTLQGTLTARLDRLGPAKELAQLAAAQGREFSRILLVATTGLTEPEVRSSLRSLIQAGLVRKQRGARNDHVFKHALIRDAAYDSMVRSQKQRVHARLATALPEHFPDIAESEPEVLAFHLQEAGRHAEALGRWKVAAQTAMARSAMVEGHAHLVAALSVLDRLPRNRENRLVRADLIKTKGLALGMMTTLVAPEIRDHHLEAAQISRELGDDGALFSAVSALWSWHLFTGERDPAEQCVRELEELAEKGDDPEAVWLVKALGGSLAFYRAEFGRSVELFEHGCRRFEDLAERPLGTGTLGLWVEAMVAVLAGAVTGRAAALWHLGQPDRAVADKARLLDHFEGRTRLNTLNAYADLELLRGDFTQARSTAEQAVALADELAPGLSLQSMVYLGAAFVGQGDPERGYPLIQQGVGGFRAIGVVWHMHRFACLEARALIALERYEEAEQLVARALADAEEKLERYLVAELHRLAGEIHLRRGNAERGRAALEQALATATRQGARALELRAAISLARLANETGESAAATARLRAVYDSFDEGHTTGDLREATALLGEAAAS